MEFNPLIPIGSNIKVDKSKIESLVHNKLFDDLPQIIKGEVIDYKMTDGMGIGYVLMTKDNLKIWVFNSEINEQSKREYKIEETSQSRKLMTKEIMSKIYKVDYDINGNRSIKALINPFNIISWLTFTLRDIF